MGSRGLNVNDGETEGGRAVSEMRSGRQMGAERYRSSELTSGAALLLMSTWEAPAGDRAWVVDPVELEQPAPRCEETVAVMGRDVALGEGEQKGEGKGEGEGAGGKVRKGEGAGDEEGRGEGEGDMRVGEDEVAFSLEFSLPLHS
ncbi:unnamed protein product [Closterium sp. NIES-54]